MEGADLQKQIDSIQETVSDIRSQIQAIVDEMGMVLEYQPKQYKLVKKGEIKEPTQTVRPF